MDTEKSLYSSQNYVIKTILTWSNMTKLILKDLGMVIVDP